VRRTLFRCVSARRIWIRDDYGSAQICPEEIPIRPFQPPCPGERPIRSGRRHRDGDVDDRARRIGVAPLARAAPPAKAIEYA
jgi:hypothetical protein